MVCSIFTLSNRCNNSLCELCAISVKSEEVFVLWWLIKYEYTATDLAAGNQNTHAVLPMSQEGLQLLTYSHRLQSKCLKNIHTLPHITQQDEAMPSEENMCNYKLAIYAENKQISLHNGSETSFCGCTMDFISWFAKKTGLYSMTPVKNNRRPSIDELQLSKLETTMRLCFSLLLNFFNAIHGKIVCAFWMNLILASCRNCIWFKL